MNAALKAYARELVEAGYNGATIRAILAAAQRHNERMMKTMDDYDIDPNNPPPLDDVIGSRVYELPIDAVMNKMHVVQWELECEGLEYLATFAHKFLADTGRNIDD